MSRVITDRVPANHVVASVIKLLDKLGGGTIKWGYIPTSGGKGVRALTYVSADTTPPRLYIHITGARRHKPPKLGAGDAEIEISRPESHQSAAHWESTTAAVIAAALEKIRPHEQCAAPLAGIADPKYLAAAAEARAAWRRFYRDNAEISPEIHVYYDDCLKFPLH